VTRASRSRATTATDGSASRRFEQPGRSALGLAGVLPRESGASGSTSPDWPWESSDPGCAPSWTLAGRLRVIRRLDGRAARARAVCRVPPLARRARYAPAGRMARCCSTCGCAAGDSATLEDFQFIDRRFAGVPGAGVGVGATCGCARTAERVLEVGLDPLRLAYGRRHGRGAGSSRFQRRGLRGSSPLPATRTWTLASSDPRVRPGPSLDTAAAVRRGGLSGPHTAATRGRSRASPSRSTGRSAIHWVAGWPENPHPAARAR